MGSPGHPGSLRHACDDYSYLLWRDVIVLPEGEWSWGTSEADEEAVANA
jgi:hypothetical protein